MGIDSIGLEAICMSQSYVTQKQHMLTLGRQHFYMEPAQVSNILTKYGLNSTLHPMYKRHDTSELFFSNLGFQHIDSIDNSDYEKASILHNMNKPITDGFQRCGYMYDGGTTEHIFNVAQVYENIVTMLEVGGVFCSVVPNNNLSGHGMYQFSPEFFLSTMRPKYGMELLELFLAKKDTAMNQWIHVRNFCDDQGGRNCSKFNTFEEVSIICVARRISEERVSFLEDPPNQHSYETIDWKRS